MGTDFYIVLVAREDEWEAASRSGEAIQGVPWPADAVEVIIDDRS
jgi:hypothetical protein